MRAGAAAALLLLLLAGRSAASPSGRRIGRRPRQWNAENQLLDTLSPTGFRASEALMQSAADASLTAAEFETWKTQMEAMMSEAGVSQYSLRWDEVGASDASAGSGPAAPNQTPHAQLLGCINDQYDPVVNMTWSAAMLDDTMGHFKAVAAWWTSNGSASAVPITLATSASVSRMPQLYAQCLSWPGPVSVALYQPLLQKQGTPLTSMNRAIMRTAVLKVAQFVADMKMAGGTVCQPDVLLVYEMFTDDVARRLLYPFNTLRNLARLQVRTPLLAMVDVDLLVSRGLYHRVANRAMGQDLVDKIQKDKAVYILPAFDVRGDHERAAWAQALTAGPKDLLVHAHQRGIVFQFASDRGYYQGHNLTNFPRWLGTNMDYNVEFETLCEPWVVADRIQLPWSDARYRGYGFDKVQTIEDINASGFTFRVLHDAFVIHRAHAKNDARDRFLKYRGNNGDEPSLFNHNLGLWTQQTNLHQLGQPFQPWVHPSTTHCQAVLPWWQTPTPAARPVR